MSILPSQRSSRSRTRFISITEDTIMLKSAPLPVGAKIYGLFPAAALRIRSNPKRHWPTQDGTYLCEARPDRTPDARTKVRKICVSEAILQEMQRAHEHNFPHEVARLHQLFLKSRNDDEAQGFGAFYFRGERL